MYRVDVHMRSDPTTTPGNGARSRTACAAGSADVADVAAGMATHAEGRRCTNVQRLVDQGVEHAVSDPR
jgi:hypothetical protein